MTLRSGRVLHGASAGATAAGPLSDDSASCLRGDLAADTKAEFRSRLQIFTFASQMDQSIDVSGFTVLLVFIQHHTD